VLFYAWSATKITKYLIMATKEINYKEQYGVIVMCVDESHQREVYETLKKKGLKLKVVTV